ncbi:hypothetical protein VCHA53O464_80057 [Vibrio chagasii]|nr:hypothetical protein VCHA53O464_80057 [Vibrio chagasii]
MIFIQLDSLYTFLNDLLCDKNESKLKENRGCFDDFLITHYLITDYYPNQPYPT